MSDVQSKLAHLEEIGQSFWLDFIRRDLLTSGKLETMVREQGIRGVTSNPTIFQKAISGSKEYEEDLREGAKGGKSAEEIYLDLAVADIRGACDVLHPVYEKTNRADGYVSLEVSPELARDTDGTIEEAKKLWERVDRENLMIKIPATPEGMPAITAVLREGINVNVTLIFSVRQYHDVIKAFLKGLEARLEDGNPVDGIASVASFFVSRIDGKIDPMLEKHPHLQGKIALANSFEAYAYYQRIIGGPRWEKLKEKGARPQRLLWASTSVKNTAYSDVLYVEELIAPDTVNTLPPATHEAFLDHGKVRSSLLENIDLREKVLGQLSEVGVSLDEVCEELLRDGVKSFADSFRDLMNAVRGRRESIRLQLPERYAESLGGLSDAVEQRLSKWEAVKFSHCLWKKDSSLWNGDEETRNKIAKRLGWLNLAESMLPHAAGLREFLQEVRGAGYERAVLIGMGGSSLFPSVLARTYGRRDGGLDLRVLDSVVPARIEKIEKEGDLAKTLFIVASKSGTTIEALTLFRYFAGRAQGGEQFCAITDPETPLQGLARKGNFRRVFTNPADIGGRYSALSLFGLVPAALLGLDVERLLDSARRMELACRGAASAAQNPGLRLGAILGESALAGRDKLTLFLSPEIASFGGWIEQLVAESTGKEGKGVLPVDGEPPASPEMYGKDRIFFYVRYDRTEDPSLDGKVEALRAAGHPVVEIRLAERNDLAGECLRWEIATAAAAAALKVNPFDEPNVSESKQITKELLTHVHQEGGLPEVTADREEGGMAFFADSALKKEEAGKNAADLLKAHFERVRAGDFTAVLAFVGETPEIRNELRGIQALLRDRFKTASTLGYGPRYLHSTGQYHKGGGDRGVFLLITGADETDPAIPGEPFGFSTLKTAQALGDFQALDRHHRRAVRCHIQGDVLEGLKTLRTHLEKIHARTHAGTA